MTLLSRNPLPQYTPVTVDHNNTIASVNVMNGQSDSITPLSVLSAAASNSDRLDKLEKDVEFIRQSLTELYNKCPKTSTIRGSDKKKCDVDCDNCGLW